jgi:hypothetical protein
VNMMGGSCLRIQFGRVLRTFFNAVLRRWPVHRLRASLACGVVAAALSCAVAQAREPARRKAPAQIDHSTVVELVVPADGGAVMSDLEAVRKWQRWLIDQGYSVDRCGIDVSQRKLVVDVSGPGQLQRLKTQGFEVVRESAMAPLEGAARTQSQYFDPTEIAAMLAQVETIQGRTIWAIEISDNPGVTEDEPAIQFNGQHHAREVATSHVVMDVVDTLTDGYAAADPTITAWVKQYKTVCVPMVNPDGVQYVFNVDSQWRKNRNGCTGGFGIDPNRNYAYLWGPGCGSSGSCGSDIYRGLSAFSELETQAMANLQDAFHFTLATSYHSYGRFIDYPYACSNGSPSQQMPEHAVIDEMMNAMAAAISAVDGVTYTAFTPVPAGGVNGDDTSWYYAHAGVYPFIVEIGASFEPSFGLVAGIVNRNRAGWQYLYGRLGEARIDVHVVSGCQPIEAEVTLTDYVFDTGELPRETVLPFGRWTFIVPANDTYTVRVSKSGFITQDVMINVANAPAVVGVDLVPVSPPPELLMGDMNLDCIVNGVDIDPFVASVLAGSGATAAQVASADFTGDCTVDSADIGPFISAALAAAACP